MQKPKVAIVRGKFLNQYEMQFFEPLTKYFDLTAFGSLTPFHDKFAFPVVKLPSPMDLPEFPYKMQLLNRIFTDAHYLFGLERALDGFDLVHTAETYYRYTQQTLDAKRRGMVKKVIATVLENIPHNNEGIWGRKGYKARARNELDHIIALTNLTRDVLLEEGADTNKITVISHFVDTQRFAPHKDWEFRVSDTKKRDFTILFVGRLEIYKGVYDVVEAVRRLLLDADLRGYRVKILFVGEGSEYTRLLEKERRLGVSWHSKHVSARYLEMPEFYHQADIFVAPSKPTSTWVEQYCTALLEAQSMGLPIVTTRTGGIPENVGDAAVVVQPGNVEEITLALKKLILQPKLRLAYAKRARTRAVMVHDKGIGAQKLARVYQKVLASE